MKKWWFLLGMLLFLVACDDNPAPRLDVTLEPSQIAANIRPVWTPSVTPTQPTPEPVLLSATTPQPTATSLVEATQQPTLEAATLEASPIPTSNAAEFQALVQNPNLVLTAEMDTTCFLANDFTPFRLIVRSLETIDIYFYTKGKWQISINNSPVGPDLAPLPPSLRADFATIAVGGVYTREEEDIGLWVLSLGDTAGITPSQTGIGLPAGEYWVIFIYSNDQDGLTQQPDGTYLIDRPAWQGTAVSSELRFKVVNDLSQC